MDSTRPRAIVLLSGGLDSATALAIAVADGFAPLPLSFRYGQRHAIETEAARNVARAAGAAEHVIIEIDLRVFGGSALTADIAVPKADVAPGARRPAPRASSAIPITYVPARNTIFLAYALALAEVRGAQDLYIGVNAVDYSGYPDCRPEYIAAFERVAALATRAAVEGRPTRIHAPLVALSKDAIIRRGLELGVDYSLTRSCYDPDDAGRACGACESCRLRLAAFERLGMRDPAPYR
ncbi:MAG: 7-cyano-7-deazaguanine synthase QueC [Phycisphaerae bacterium]|jgi:7-cyano-7-deazaguanine synthase|nr:7-cyano-7-deazaguanine synthase QueC [Phycisphaerae bacterium]MCZ2398917.1 7-cyano-7-deazaguanine synthase QueC [Phycisphaerae bacterium]